MIRKVQFESQERCINQVLAALKENGINSIEEANEICMKRQVSTHIRCVKTHSSSASRMLSGHTFVVLLSPSRRAWKTAAEATEAIGIGLPELLYPWISSRLTVR